MARDNDWIRQYNEQQFAAGNQQAPTTATMPPMQQPTVQAPTTATMPPMQQPTTSVAPPQQSAPQQPQEGSNRFLETADDLLSGIVYGGNSAARAVLNLIPSETLRSILAELKAKDDPAYAAARARSPYATSIGSALGGSSVGTTLTAFGTAATPVAYGSLALRSLGYGLSGAAAGAAITEGDLQDRATGGFIGGTLGLAAPSIAYGINKAVPHISRLFSRATGNFNNSVAAPNEVLDAVARKQNPEMVARRLGAMDDIGLKAPPGVVTGSQILQDAESALPRSLKGRAAFEAADASNEAALKGRLTDLQNTAILQGKVPDYKQTVDLGQSLYEQAKGIPLKSADLTPLLQPRSKTEAEMLANAFQLAKDDGRITANALSDLTNVNELLQVRNKVQQLIPTKKLDPTGNALGSKLKETITNIATQGDPDSVAGQAIKTAQKLKIYEGMASKLEGIGADNINARTLYGAFLRPNSTARKDFIKNMTDVGVNQDQLDNFVTAMDMFAQHRSHISKLTKAGAPQGLNITELKDYIDIGKKALGSEALSNLLVDPTYYKDLSKIANTTSAIKFLKQFGELVVKAASTSATPELKRQLPIGNAPQAPQQPGAAPASRGRDNDWIKQYNEQQFNGGK